MSPLLRMLLIALCIGWGLGTVGSTGLSTACHLHLSLYKDGAGSDPLAYVTKERRS